jgi:MFS family permease
VSPTFRALQNTNYRLWASGAIVSNTGTWMQRIAQDWLVLTQLTNNSGTAVGITTALQFAPVLLLAPVAGLIADRFERRKVLITTQISSGILALILGLMVITDVAQLWHVYVMAALLGVVAAIDAPARQAFVSELVPIEDLPNAVGLNSASFHGGRLIGPGIAGLLITWFGTGPVFLINAASFGAVVFSLTRMRKSELRVQPRSGGKGSIRAGLSYVRHRPDLILILAIVGMVGTFGLNFQLTSALMARLVFEKGAGEYGILGSIMAIGSLGGAFLAARREHPRMRLVIGATLVFGVASIAASLMPTYWSFAISLIPVGLASLTLMTAANATIQLSTTPAMRGRVMALYMAVFMGGTPIGAPLIGWVGEAFGPRYTILLGGVMSIVTAVAAVLWLRHSQGARIRLGWERGPRLRVTTTESRAQSYDLTPGDVTPGGVTPGEVAAGSVTPGGVTPQEVAPGELVPGGVVPRDVRPGAAEAVAGTSNSRSAA